MSAVLSATSEDGRDTPAKNILPTKPIDIREGDWKAFLAHSRNHPDSSSLQDHFGSLTSYKRACALAYLGRRAQIHGGVCSATHPHVLTPHFIAALEASNKALRYARYPWLESLVAILAEIERIQDQIASNNNVITMLPTGRG